MVEWILTALALLGTSQSGTAVAPPDTSTSAQSRAATPTPTPDAGTTDGKHYPPGG